MSRGEMMYMDSIINNCEVALRFREEILEGFDKNTLSVLVRRLYRRGVLSDWEREYLYEKLGLV